MQPDPEVVFTIIVSRERGILPLAVEYDLATGQERRSRRFEKGGVVPVSCGQYTVWRDGYLDVETLGYVPVEWGNVRPAG